MEIKRLKLLYFRPIAKVELNTRKMSVFNSACFCIKPTEISLCMQKTRKITTKWSVIAIFIHFK